MLRREGVQLLSLGLSPLHGLQERPDLFPACPSVSVGRRCECRRVFVNLARCGSLCSLHGLMKVPQGSFHSNKDRKAQTYCNCFPPCSGQMQFRPSFPPPCSPAHPLCSSSTTAHKAFWAGPAPTATPSNPTRSFAMPTSFEPPLRRYPCTSLPSSPPQLHKVLKWTYTSCNSFYPFQTLAMQNAFPTLRRPPPHSSPSTSAAQGVGVDLHPLQLILPLPKPGHVEGKVWRGQPHT